LRESDEHGTQLKAGARELVLVSGSATRIPVSAPLQDAGIDELRQPPVQQVTRDARTQQPSSTTCPTTA
jgi:hypothetical protein